MIIYEHYNGREIFKVIYDGSKNKCTKEIIYKGDDNKIVHHEPCSRIMTTINNLLLQGYSIHDIILEVDKNDNVQIRKAKIKTLKFCIEETGFCYHLDHLEDIPVYSKLDLTDSQQQQVIDYAKSLTKEE